MRDGMVLKKNVCTHESKLETIIFDHSNIKIVFFK